MLLAGHQSACVAVWNPADHVLWCLSAQQDSLKKANMKRENKAYSFKEQIIELELKEVSGYHTGCPPSFSNPLWVLSLLPLFCGSPTPSRGKHITLSGGNGGASFVFSTCGAVGSSPNPSSFGESKLHEMSSASRCLCLPSSQSNHQFHSSPLGCFVSRLLCLVCHIPASRLPASFPSLCFVHQAVGVRKAGIWSSGCYW